MLQGQGGLNMATSTFLLAGFGGQGILFMGKTIAIAGLIADKELSWLPSYGPEMRGGTCNCSVTISDEEIGSPLVLDPSCLVVMNQPSFDKFESSAAPGAHIFVDSSLIKSKSTRTDIKAVYIPATLIARENDLKGLANIVMLGKIVKEYEFLPKETILKALEKNNKKNNPDITVRNNKAFDLGYNY